LVTGDYTKNIYWEISKILVKVLFWGVAKIHKNTLWEIWKIWSKNNFGGVAKKVQNFWGKKIFWDFFFFFFLGGFSRG
jgi:hypothetical protein